GGFITRHHWPWPRRVAASNAGGDIMSLSRMMVNLAAGAFLFASGPLRAQTSEDMKRAAEQSADQSKERAASEAQQESDKAKSSTEEQADKAQKAAEDKAKSANEAAQKPGENATQ